MFWGSVLFVLPPALRMLPVLPLSLSCLPFLSLLKLKGFLKTLHSEIKPPVNLAQSAALELSEVTLVDNLPPKSLSCLKCLSSG